MDKIINIAVVAHVDAGKSTLVDGLLRQSGVFRANEELVDERIENLEEFINYVIDHVISGATRSDYFKQNRYSPRILLTLVGGKTILEWYTDIIVYYKRVPKTKDVLDNVQAQWMNYVKNNGYSFFTDDFLYAQFQDMVNKVIPEVNEIISVEQEKENLLSLIHI